MAPFPRNLLASPKQIKSWLEQRKYLGKVVLCRGYGSVVLSADAVEAGCVAHSPSSASPVLIPADK